MDEINQTPEELISGMTPEEICELLEEIGIDATSEEAATIQQLIEELGSLEGALEALTGSEERRAA